MKLRFCESEIPYWAERYSDPDGEELENELTDKDLVNKVQQQQYLTRDILKKVARWSISVEKYNYTFSFWLEYISFCRELAKSNDVDMRTLDRALWEYSRKNQT